MIRRFKTFLVLLTVFLIVKSRLTLLPWPPVRFVPSIPLIPTFLKLNLTRGRLTLISKTSLVTLTLRPPLVLRLLPLTRRCRNSWVRVSKPVIMRLLEEWRQVPVVVPKRRGSPRLILRVLKATRAALSCRTLLLREWRPFNKRPSVSVLLFSVLFSLDPLHWGMNHIRGVFSLALLR